MTERILEAVGMLLGGMMAFKMGQEWDEFSATLARRRRRAARRRLQRTHDRLIEQLKKDSE